MLLPAQLGQPYGMPAVLGTSYAGAPPRGGPALQAGSIRGHIRGRLTRWREHQAGSIGGQVPGCGRTRRRAPARVCWRPESSQGLRSQDCHTRPTTHYTLQAHIHMCRHASCSTHTHMHTCIMQSAIMRRHHHDVWSLLMVNPNQNYILISVHGVVKHAISWP